MTFSNFSSFQAVCGLFDYFLSCMNMFDSVLARVSFFYFEQFQLGWSIAF